MDNDIDSKMKPVDGKQLLALIKEAAELSRMSALVNLAYSRAKVKEGIQEASSNFKKMIDDRITDVAGKIKENSKLYDDFNAKREGLTKRYEETLSTIGHAYEGRIELLLAQRAKLEIENLALAADCNELREEKEKKELEYRRGEKGRDKDKQMAKQIAKKKAEAERLASEGDVEGARGAIAEYKALKETLVMETTEGMLEVASISQQVKSNRTQARNNRTKISEIDASIQQLEQEATQKIKEAQTMKDTEMVELNKSNSVFRKLAMFASKTATRLFNKGKAINDEVLEPMRAKIDNKMSEIKENLGAKAHEVQEKVSGSFKDRLDKAMQTGRSIKQGAIDRLSKSIQDKNIQRQQDISTKKQYLEEQEETL